MPLICCSCSLLYNSFLSCYIRDKILDLLVFSLCILLAEKWKQKTLAEIALKRHTQQLYRYQPHPQDFSLKNKIGGAGAPPIFLGKTPGDKVDTDTNEFFIKFSPQFWISSTIDKSSWSLIINDEQNRVVTLSLAKTSAGYPDKESNNRKIERAREKVGGGKRGQPRLTFPSSPAQLFFFPLPSLPTTQRGLRLQRREVLWKRESGA